MNPTTNKQSCLFSQCLSPKQEKLIRQIHEILSPADAWKRTEQTRETLALGLGVRVIDFCVPIGTEETIFSRFEDIEGTSLYVSAVMQFAPGRCYSALYLPGDDTTKWRVYTILLNTITTTVLTPQVLSVSLYATADTEAEARDFVARRLAPLWAGREDMIFIEPPTLD